MVLFALCSSSQVTFGTFIRPKFSAQTCSHSSQGSSPISSHPGLLPSTSFWSLAGWLNSACPALLPWAMLLELRMSLPPLAPWVSYIAIVSGTKPFLALFQCIIWVLLAVLHLGEAAQEPSHFTVFPLSFLPLHPVSFIFILSVSLWIHFLELTLAQWYLFSLMIDVLHSGGASLFWCKTIGFNTLHSVACQVARFAIIA